MKNSNLKIIKHKFIDNKQEVKFIFKNNEYFFVTNLIGKIQIKT